MIDTHAHLDYDRYDEDRAEVLERAAEAGVRQVIAVGIDVPTSRHAAALAESTAGVFATVGLHPHDARKATEDTYRAFRQIAKHPRVVAVGEQGLDFHYDNSPREQQQEAFRQQIRLAIDTELPVVIHTRDASRETWQIIEDEWLDGAGRPRGVGGEFHCFSGDLAFARQCVEAGFYLGIGGVVTFKNASTLRDVVRNIPLGQLVLETDAPYLTPVPYRGKRNEPAFVPHIARRIAELKGVDIVTVARETTRNARDLFRLPADDLLALEEESAR